MSSDLLRQRRNLLILSAILFFLKFAEIEIEKFSIVGIEFSSFKNPNSIFMALWIAWIYFAVRYYQYFSQEGFPCFKCVFREVLDGKSAKKIDKIVRKDYPTKITKNVTYTTLKGWGWEYSGQIEKKPDGIGGHQIENFKLPISRWHLFPEIINSFFYVALNRSAFTDYILPIILAIIALCYCFKGWDGYSSDSYFSGVLVRYVDDFERVIA